MRCMIFLFCLLLAACSGSRRPTTFNPYQYTIQKEVIARKAAVVSAHALASKVGLAILKEGGNAVDAAIAVQLALAVVYPAAGNLGGGGFLVARLADGKTLALDYREMAPAAAHRDMYLDDRKAVMEGKSLRGHLAPGVPGTVAGLFASHKYGRLPFTKLIQPAIDLAQNGFRLTEREAGNLNSIQDDLAKYNTRRNALQKTVWKEGDTLQQPDLAATLIRIRDHGQAGFYEGETARLITEEMQRGSGLISRQDLAAYTAKWRTPHIFNYRGYRVIGMPMPSSGGTLLHQMLKMIETKPVGQYGFHSPAAVQLMIEAERRAYADRAKHMGDADFYNIPGWLTDSTYLVQRIRDYQPGMAGNSVNTGPGQYRESEETTHLSVLDEAGNAVSVTTTLNDSYGSRTVVGGAGFLLNNEMDDFSVKPGTPNMYGAIGGEANAIAPRKRMLSSMTPTLVLQHDKLYMIVGTPGGTTIPTSVFQTIVNIIDFGMTGTHAVNAPKFHHQWLPDEVFIEKSFPLHLRSALAGMGYTLTERSPIGRVELIRVLPDGRIEAVADTRGEDSAEGY